MEELDFYWIKQSWFDPDSVWQICFAIQPFLLAPLVVHVAWFYEISWLAEADVQHYKWSKKSLRIYCFLRELIRIQLSLYGRKGMAELS